MRKRRLEYKIGHLFGGMGGGAYGAMRARVAINGVEATFRTLGSVDIDPESCEDFETLTGVKATCADVHEMTVEDLRVAFQHEMPDMVLLSPPCKGFSRLLGAAKAREPKYQKLNRLVLDGLWLLCNAWDEPPPLIFIENVPGITSRGKDLLRKARMLLRSFGYRVTEDDYHDCGELGGLAQHRKRFFLVARCERRVPYYVYQPGKMRVKACGEVLNPLPIPGDIDAGGPLHALPKISWLNWIRLALIPAGGDWRDLPGVVPEGKKRREIHRRHAITKWGDPVPTVTGPGGHAADYVADPRPGVALGQTARGADGFKGRPGLFGVQSWDEPMPTVTGFGID